MPSPDFKKLIACGCYLALLISSASCEKVEPRPQERFEQNVTVIGKHIQRLRCADFKEHTVMDCYIGPVNAGVSTSTQPNSRGIRIVITGTDEYRNSKLREQFSGNLADEYRDVDQIFANHFYPLDKTHGFWIIRLERSSAEDRNSSYMTDRCAAIVERKSVSQKISGHTSIEKDILKTIGKNDEAKIMFDYRPNNQIDIHDVDGDRYYIFSDGCGLQETTPF